MRLGLYVTKMSDTDMQYPCEDTSPTTETDPNPENTGADPNPEQDHSPAIDELMRRDFALYRSDVLPSGRCQV